VTNLNRKFLLDKLNDFFYRKNKPLFFEKNMETFPITKSSFGYFVIHSRKTLNYSHCNNIGKISTFIDDRIYHLRKFVEQLTGFDDDIENVNINDFLKGLSNDEIIELKKCIRNHPLFDRPSVPILASFDIDYVFSIEKPLYDKTTQILFSNSYLLFDTLDDDIEIITSYYRKNIHTILTTKPDETYGDETCGYIKKYDDKIVVTVDRVTGKINPPKTMDKYIDTHYFLKFPFNVKNGVYLTDICFRIGFGLGNEKLIVHIESNKLFFCMSTRLPASYDTFEFQSIFPTNAEKVTFTIFLKNNNQ
jgi:hypothetical protein